MEWRDLAPETSILEALEHAGPRPTAGNQDEKRAWSERFANGCAIAVANVLRKNPKLQKKDIRPLSLEKGTEPLTPLGGSGKKRVDVTVVDAVFGLEIGVSLKGSNFRDRKGNNFDKNLTGRVYELADEMKLVHDHLPHAFMVAIYFLPLDAVSDKTEKAKSAFANTVLTLRRRTGRLDTAFAGQGNRSDSSYVGLYATGDEHVQVRRGACRFLNVLDDPPRRGRPQISTTSTLAEMAERIVEEATGDILNARWADPEPEH